MWFKVDPTNPLDMSVLVCFNVYYPNTHTQTWPRTPPWGSNHVRTTTAQPLPADIYPVGPCVELGVPPSLRGQIYRRLRGCNACGLLTRTWATRVAPGVIY